MSPAQVPRLPPLLGRPLPELLAAGATAAVTGYGLASAGPWRDEMATRLAAGRSLEDLLALTRTVDLVHLPYYLLAHGVLAVHDSITALRALSAMALAATAAVLVATGRRLGSARAGLTAGLVLAVAPLASRYGQEARPYALAALAASLAAWRLVIAVDGRRADWGWYAVALVVTGLANVLALLVVAGHLVFVVATRRRALRAWFTAVCAAGAGTAPFAIASFSQSAQVGWLTRPGADDLAQVLAAPLGGLLLPALLLTAAAVLGADRAVLVLGAAWGLLPPVLLWLGSQIHPLFDGRYAVASLPGIALAVASLVSVPRQRSLPPAVAVAALVVALGVHGWPAQRGYRDPAAGHGEDVRGVVRIVTEASRPGDAVLFVPHHLRIVLLQGPDAGPPDAAGPPPDDVALDRGPLASTTLTGVDVTAAELSRRLAGRERVWLVTKRLPGAGGDARTPADRAKLALLTRDFTEVRHEEVTFFRVTLHLRRSGAQGPLLAAVGEDLALPHGQAPLHLVDER
jgi:mannosyltransferase